MILGDHRAGAAEALAVSGAGQVVELIFIRHVKDALTGLAELRIHDRNQLLGVFWIGCVAFAHEQLGAFVAIISAVHAFVLSVVLVPARDEVLDAGSQRWEVDEAIGDGNPLPIQELACCGRCAGSLQSEVIVLA